MKLVIFDNLFNESRYFRISKNINKFIKYYDAVKISRLVKKYKKKYDNLEITIYSSRKDIISSTNVNTESLSNYRLDFNHKKYLELKEKVVKKTKQNLKRLLDNLLNIKTFHFKGMFIGKILEFYFSMFFKEIFGEYELVKNIVKNKDYNKVIFYNCNPNFIDFFQELNSNKITFEFFCDSLMKFVRKITILLRYKHFFPMTLGGLRSFFLKYFKQSYFNDPRNKINQKSEQKALIIHIANTFNQNKSIEPLYKYVKGKYDQLFYRNQYRLFKLKEFNKIIKYIFLFKNIWTENFKLISKGLRYDQIKLNKSLIEFFNTHLFYYIIQIYITTFYLNNFFKKNIPSIVTIGSKLDINGRLNAKYCKLKEIPSIYIPHADLPIWDEIVTKTDFTYLSIPGEMGKNYLIKKGEPEEKIIITGRPSYDNLYKGEIKPLYKIKDMFTNRIYEFNKNKFTILLASNPIGEDSIRKILLIVINSLKKLNLLENLIIKLHPREVGKFYNKFLRKELKVNPIIVKDYNILRLIKSSDLLLTEISNTVLESMIIGKPLILLNLINSDFHLNGRYLFTNSNYVETARSKNMLTKKLKNLKNNKDYYHEYSKRLKNLVPKFSYENNKKIPSELINNLFLKIIQKNNHLL